MKKLFLLSLFSVMSTGAFAADMPFPLIGNTDSMPSETDMIANLTAEQKSCIEAYGCKIPEKPVMGEKIEMPKQDTEAKDVKQPEIKKELDDSMDCMRKAMKSCGIEMPEHPESQKLKRPNFNFLHENLQKLIEKQKLNKQKQ